MNKFILKNSLFKALMVVMVSLFITACSKKVVNPEVQRLQSQKELLDLNTKLNKLNLSLEKELGNVNSLVADVDKANDKASKSASEASKRSADVSKHPGDSRIAKKADKASRNAASDAKRALKLNKKLSGANDKVKSYQKDIANTQTKLGELNSKINFAPNE
ncbi:hypothetical protein [Pedobacter arcticus]|uniref:hypothetical protein n=1 Tax=Pedobacter arcticus TaxID=752140 RepID=UPI00037988BC|nr:hypothetical protein [Pedobacter arcticus]